MVVVHLYGKDDSSTCGRDEVGDKKENTRTDTLFYAKHQALTHKAETAYCHHAETRQRDSVCLAGNNCLDSLWQVSQDETNAT